MRGRVVSCYPACAPELRAAGGEYADIAIDLVKAPAWPAHADWLSKFAAVLGTKIEA